MDRARFLATVSEMEQFPEGFRQYEPIRPRGTDWRGLARKIWAPVGAAIGFLVKFGAVLYKIKFFSLALSLFVSAGFYVLYGGWWFGIGLVVLLFVHEMGHVLEAKRQGLPVSAPFFIPFLGAAIQMKRMPQSAWHEALNGIAGPILGSLGAAAIWAVGESIHSRHLIALAFLGFLINLFNLIPIIPLDGGRIVSAIHPALWLVGLLALVGLTILRPNGLLILILFFAATELWRRWKARHHPAARGYYTVRPWQRAAVALAYFGLAALLVLGMHATHVPRHLF